MAKRGSTKDLSVRHEEYIAKLYCGIRSRSSGAADTDQGDVRCPRLLIECKMTGRPGKEIKRPKLLRDFEKITEEAWSEGKEPMLALRYYAPDSLLANPDGWVDLVVQKAGEE